MKYLKFKINSFINSLKKIFLTKKKTKKKSLQLHFLQIVNNIKIDIDEQDALGRTASDSTLEWWSKQNKKVREEAFDQKGSISVNETLKQINKWMVGVDVLWGQGYGFDMTILENMYRSVGVPIPWNFWQVRDSRTLFKCCKEDPRKSMQTDLHNALADAYFQAKSIQVAYKELGVKQ